MDQTCTIVTRHLSSLSNEDIERFANKLSNPDKRVLVLSVLANPDEKLKILIDYLLQEARSDIAIIDGTEIRIKKVKTYMSERNMENKRVYFLNTQRVLY